MARFNLDLAPDAKVVVSNLMQKTGLRTQTDVFENALALLSWAVREVERGRIIASLDETTKQYAELHTPALMGVANTLVESRRPSDRRPDGKGNGKTRMPEFEHTGG